MNSTLYSPDVWNWYSTRLSEYIQELPLKIQAQHLKLAKLNENESQIEKKRVKKEYLDQAMLTFCIWFIGLMLWWKNAPEEVLAGVFLVAHAYVWWNLQHLAWRSLAFKNIKQNPLLEAALSHTLTNNPTAVEYWRKTLVRRPEPEHRDVVDLVWYLKRYTKTSADLVQS
jgi:hypothetical protein